MNVIKGLIIKDLMNIKSYKATIIFMILIFSAVSFFNGDITTFLPICITVIFGMIGISSFSYDNISNADKFILSFPTNRKDIVKARYIYILLLTIIGCILGVSCAMILQIIKSGSFEEVGNILSTVVGAFLGTIMVQIIQIPIMYKFGAEKGRIIQMISVILIFSFISAIAIFLTKILPYEFEDLLNILISYGYIIISIVMLIIYIISYKISCKIYSKKEI